MGNDDVLDAGAGSNMLAGNGGMDTYILWDGASVGMVTNMLPDFAAGDMIKFGDADSGKVAMLTADTVYDILQTEKMVDDELHLHAHVRRASRRR